MSWESDHAERVSGKPSGVSADGKPIYKPLTDDQRAEIVGDLETWVVSGRMSITRFVRKTAKRYGKNEVNIWRFVKSIRDTTQLARSYFRASAFKMARKVVKKGTTAELLDIMSRPNIGVLDPVKKVEGQSGMFMSISVDSLGGVKQVSAGIKQVNESPIGYSGVQPGFLTGEVREQEESESSAGEQLEKRSGRRPVAERVAATKRGKKLQSFKKSGK